MVHAFLSDGRLYVRDGAGEILEIESTFVTEKEARADRAQTYSGWKGRTSPEDRCFGAQAMWGQQAAGAVAAYRFRSVVAADAKTLFYTLANNTITGLFEYDLEEAFETRLFHRNDLVELGFDYSPARREFVMAVQGEDQRCGLELLNDRGSPLRGLTDGDCRDSNPSFSRRHPHQIVYQSAGIARDDEGFVMMYGPESVCRLDMEREATEVVCEDEACDFLLPREDHQGNLYCIRRPYRGGERHSPVKAAVDILLFPFRFAVAVVGFLDAFTKLFNQQSFKADGPAMPMGRKEKYVRVLGQTIEMSKVQRTARLKGEPSLVPGSWELVRVRPGGEMEVVARHVAAYDIDPQGQVYYTNGYRVSRIGTEGKEPVFRHTLIEQVRAGG